VSDHEDGVRRPRIATVVGARPQFVKAAAVTPALAAAGVEEILIHTGQHYDWEMSASFFAGFRLPRPAYDLEVGSGSHGSQTGRMLARIEEVLVRERPRLVVVYGDTNSTLAGALAAVKLHVPVAHVEAGLRSFDRRMPEEINRVVTDHVSTLLLAPTQAAVENLTAEGITQGVLRTGDVMLDLLGQYQEAVERAVPQELQRFGVERQGFGFVTVHRAENTDDKERWESIVEALRRLASAGLPIIWAAHPRTAALMEGCRLPGVKVVPPLGYLTTQALVRAAAVVLTDSGGLQKEAAFHSTPCVVLRERSEWVELVAERRVLLAGVDPEKIVALALPWWSTPRPLGEQGVEVEPAAQAVATAIKNFLGGGG
jgi:UDP-N-acetylglucosamine 2-epimerase